MSYNATRALELLRLGTQNPVAVFHDGQEETTYGDYRAFDGFLMPMRIVWQDDTGSYPLQLSSLEINTVKESDLRMPTNVTPLKH